MATEKRLMGYDPITLESFTRHMTKHREPYDQYDMGYVDAVEQIENFLEYNTVDAVEVVHGHWTSLTDCANAGVYCSVCHKKVWKEDYAWCNRKNKLRSNYCPNCGAKMDGDGDEKNL